MTKLPEIEVQNGKIRVDCATPGARIGYRYTSEKAAHKGWKFYTEPIEEKTNDTLEIITHRLGYKYAITTIANGSIVETVYPPNRHDKQ